MIFWATKKYTNPCKTMGRRPKKTLACISSLGCQQAHVEDITNPQDPDFDGNQPQNQPVDLLEEGFFMLDEDLGSDSHGEDEIDDEECEDESMCKPKISWAPHTSPQSAGKTQEGVPQKVWKRLNTLLYVILATLALPTLLFFGISNWIFCVSWHLHNRLCKGAGS